MNVRNADFVNHRETRCNPVTVVGPCQGTNEAQEWYDTKATAEILGRSAYSVREWCRLGRVRTKKRRCGRGGAKEWMISHEELERIKSEGLLPLDKTMRYGEGDSMTELDVVCRDQVHDCLY